MNDTMFKKELGFGLKQNLEDRTLGNETVFFCMVTEFLNEGGFNFT